MNIFSKAIELDIAYFDTFTKRTNTSWGYLFCNEDQPSYFDANHAHIHEAPSDPKAVIEEVVHFYSSKNITPRFYIYNTENQTKLIEELYSHNFKFEELVHPVQLWNRKLHARNKNNKITIEKVTEANFNEALDIECSIKEFGGKVVREKAFPEEFKHPSFTHYLLRYEGAACSTACIFETQDQARIETVATIEQFRGKGLIGELIYFLQEEVLKKGMENLWIFPIDEKIEMVYAKNGFDTVGKFKIGHAFLHGKSVQEIRKG